MEQNNIELWFGWTNDFNVPRVFYYSGDFVQDGAIEALNPAGKYTYEFLEEETRLFISNAKINFTFTGQDQSGGNVHSGNTRYTVHLLTENKTPTDWLDLDNPVSAFIASTSGNPKEIFGDKHIETPKINNFTVNNIPPGLFSFIELARVEYNEDSMYSAIIKREVISPDQTSINLQHTGNETEVALVLGLLNEKNINYPTAKNMISIDNRLLLSNLTNRQVYDFREWAKTFEYKLKQKELDAVGDIGANFGEYQDPNNVNNNMGYMYNETYRFMVKGRLKTGGYTQTFWTNDIKFNTDQTDADGRRISSFTNYDLTNQVPLPQVPTGKTPTKIKVPYVEYKRPDFDYLIDGLKVSEIIDQIIIERAEVVPEVLATGMTILAINQDWINPNHPPGIKMNFPLVGEAYFGGSHVPLNPAASEVVIVHIETDSNMGTFYSPDMIYNNVSISYKSNDKLLNFGVMAFSNDEVEIISNLFGAYAQFASQANSFDTLSINDAKILERDAIVTVGGQVYSSKFDIKKNIGGTDYTINWESEKGLVIQTSTSINTINPTLNFSGLIGGVRYCQYFREKTNKYGDKTKTRSIPTGTTYDVDSSATTFNVFGGDTFIQKNYFKYKYNVGSNLFSTMFPFKEWGAEAIIFYSQNKVNTQMRSEDDESDNDFPKADADDWLRQQPSPAFKYNRGYNIKNGVNSNRAYDPSLKYQTNLPVRIIYSAIKPQNSLVDTYREFQALNFKDLDLSFGEIVHMANGNNELIAWQKRAFKLLNFNTRNILISTDGTELIVGTGAVMAGDDRILSAYGCDNKWSIIEGKSEQGNKMFAWINTEFKKVIRYSYDGTRSLEYIKKMRSFFKNYLDWVKGKDEPVGGEGIHGVWDDENGDLIWTVNGSRIIEEIIPVEPHEGGGEEEIMG